MQKLVGIHPRVCGCENECGCSGLKDLGAVLYNKIPRHPRQTDQNPRDWLEWGGVIYNDNGVLEYATPADINTRLVALYAFAGDLEMRDRVLEAFKRVGVGELRLTTGNIGGQLRYDGMQTQRAPSLGQHDSYELDFPDHTVSGIIKAHLDPIMAYQVSAILLTGNGYFAPDGTFYVSERAGLTTREYAQLNTGAEKCIFMHRTGSCGPKNRFRLQVCVNDTNLLYEPTWLRLTLMDLMLLMLENQALWGPILVSPILALYAINADPYNGPYAKVPVKFRGQTLQLNGVEIQRIYYRQARRFVRRFGLREYDEALNLWRQILDALERRDFRWLIGHLGWVTRRHEANLRQLSGYAAYQFGIKSMGLIIQRPRRPDDPEDAPAIFNSPLLALRRKYHGEEFMAAVSALRDTIPQWGRSNLMSRFIRRCRIMRLRHGITDDWSTLWVEHNSCLYEFSVQDPHAAENEPLEKWLQATEDTPVVAAA